MADYSTLYPTLTRKKAQGTPLGLGRGTAPGVGANTLSGLSDTWDPSGNFIGDTNVTGDFSGKSGPSWGSVIGAAAPLALSLFAPKDQYNVPGAIKTATADATALGAQGAKTFTQGSDALQPVLHYLAAVESGDPQALMDATMPERRRVIDQYDTARQAAQFSPRGGGTASALVNANTREAGDLAAIGGTARKEALSMGAQLGSNLVGQGTNAENASVNHLTNLLSPMLQGKQHDEQSTFQTFASIAGLMAMFI